MKLFGKVNKHIQKKKQIKQVTLVIDSKILIEQPQKSLNKTLRLPLSTIAINTNSKSQQSSFKTPRTKDLNSTLKRSNHSKSKSQDKRGKSMPRSKSLSSISSSPHLKNVSVMSKQSNMKCFQKIIFKVTDFFEKQSIYWQLKSLSYQNILRLLYQFKYIHYYTQKQLVQQNMMDELKKSYQFWLNLTQYPFANLNNFVYLVCCIQNIPIQFEQVQSAINSFVLHLQKRQINQIHTQQYIPEYRFIGVQIYAKWNYYGHLIIDKNSLFKIQQEFNSFKINKLNFNQKSIPYLQLQKINLSSKTNHLAFIKRQKIQSIIRSRKPNIQKITLADILNFKQQEQKSIPLSARTYDQSKSSVFQSNKKKVTKLKLNRKYDQPLFENLSRPKVIKVKSRQQLDFERNKKQCTFKPEINPLKVNQTQDLFQIKNVIKTIERMKSIRQSKIQQQQLRQTGWTNNNNRSKSKDRHQQSVNHKPLYDRHQCNQEKENEQKKQIIPIVDTPKQQNIFNPLKIPQKTQQKTDIRIPLLFIDINIDQTQKQRLVIYQQDNSSQLAATFAKKHNLTKDMQIKLKQLLDYQMNSILTKIEQELDEQEDTF